MTPPVISYAAKRTIHHLDDVRSINYYSPSPDCAVSLLAGSFILSMIVSKSQPAQVSAALFQYGLKSSEIPDCSDVMVWTVVRLFRKLTKNGIFSPTSNSLNIECITVSFAFKLFISDNNKFCTSKFCETKSEIFFSNNATLCSNTESSFHVCSNSMMDVAGGWGNLAACTSHIPTTQTGAA